MESIITPPAKTEISIYDRKFSAAGWALGGVGTVIWAASKHKKGKFWWFIGGSIIGSTVGYLLDSAAKKAK